MHKILKAIHEVAPIRGIKVTRESWRTHNGKGRNEVVHVQIKHPKIVEAERIAPLILERFRRSGWVTDTVRIGGKSHTHVIKNGKSYDLTFDTLDGIKIEPQGQRVSKLREFMLMRAVKMHH